MTNQTVNPRPNIIDYKKAKCDLLCAEMDGSRAEIDRKKEKLKEVKKRFKEYFDFEIDQYIEGEKNKFTKEFELDENEQKVMDRVVNEILRGGLLSQIIF